MDVSEGGRGLGAHTTENGKESHQASESDRKGEIRQIDGDVFLIKFVLHYR